MIRSTFEEKAAMFPEALNHEQFVALRSAYGKACIELGLGPDEIGRERLAQLMITLAEDGETDPDVIRAHAVHRMQPPAAGLFHAI
jgi:hypothetical protein